MATNPTYYNNISLKIFLSKEKFCFKTKNTFKIWIDKFVSPILFTWMKSENDMGGFLVHMH